MISEQVNALIAKEYSLDAVTEHVFATERK
jgi:hypothetical protein